MSKPSEKKDDEDKESLVDRYKKFFLEMDKQGQDVNKIYATFGGKESFFQRIQDIEDDVADDYSDVFKKAYENGDIRRCVRTLFNIIRDDILFHKRGLRRTLYSEGNLLKNPLNYGFDEIEYKKIILIIASTINHLKKVSKNENELISEENAKSYKDELIQLYYLYDCLYTNRLENEKRLNESAFLKLSLPQIIQSFLVFFQSQCNLVRIEMSKRWKSQTYMTGLESEVASERVFSNPEENVSFSDSFEHLLEAMDTLFRYVFFLKKTENITENDIRQTNFITPYESSEYEKISSLSSCDVMFSRMESLFRYSKWNISFFKDSKGNKGYGFYPSDDKFYKTHIAAMLRRKHNVIMEYGHAALNEREKPQKADNGCAEADVSGSGSLPGGFYGEYLDVSRRLDLNDIESFHFRSDYELLKSYAKSMKEFIKESNKPYYLTCKFNEMCVDEYLDAYVFLYTFGNVYYCAAETRGEQKQLVPLISLRYLYNEFSSVSGYDYEKAKKLINCFVFNKDIAKKKKYGDIFVRPLICVGAEMVLLSEGLINQINLNRSIEVLLEWNNVDLAPMGKELEHRIINKLKDVPELSVNSKKIEFLAYDNRNVEFDFIALLDDYIIVMEMKAVLQPYDEDELYRRHMPISDGVEQVIRRTKIIQKDWGKFKEMCSVDLPDKPYDDDHIIKVVCSDIADFTGLEERGVILTDEATVIKYFTNPYLRAVKQMGNSQTFIQKKLLWPDGRPTAKEFISYLRNPDTMDVFMQPLTLEWMPIPLLEGYKPMIFQNIVLKEDPLKKLAEKYKL